MLEIKNKLSNSKEKKKQDFFNKYMNLKKKIRYKLIRYFPLTKKEEVMYKNISVFNHKARGLDKDKYFQLNKRIYLLSAISKNDLDDFYFGLVHLLKNNPSKNQLRQTSVTENLRKSIFDFQGTNNGCGWLKLGEITPHDEKLSEYVKSMDLFLFSFSDDYLGISVGIEFSTSFNKYYNDTLIGDVDNKMESYRKYYIGNKIYVSPTFKSKNILRKELIDDILIEIKMRTYNFLTKYIKLLPLRNKAPISLDVYFTNYDYGNEENLFLRSYNLYDYRKNGNVEVIYNSKEGQEFVCEDIYYSYEEKINDLNRSAIIVVKSEKYKSNYISSESFLNYFVETMYFYFVNEFDRLIAEERKKLSIISNKKEKKLYKNYSYIIEMVSEYKMLLNNIEIDKYGESYYDREMEKEFKYLNKRKNILIAKHDSIEKEFANVITIKNYQSSSRLARLSIGISLISFIAASVFSCITIYNDIIGDKTKDECVTDVHKENDNLEKNRE